MRRINVRFLLGTATCIDYENERERLGVRLDPIASGVLLCLYSCLHEA